MTPERPQHAFTYFGGFPGGDSGKESDCQWRRHKRHGFEPWVLKIPWSGKRKPTPVFLPGKFHAQSSLANCSPWGHRKPDMSERLSTHTNTHTHIHTHTFNLFSFVLMHRFVSHLPSPLNKVTKEQAYVQLQILLYFLDNKIQNLRLYWSYKEKESLIIVLFFCFYFFSCLANNIITAISESFQSYNYSINLPSIFCCINTI